MSYNNGSGGTLTLPSPTHVHHVDISSHVRSLRRSLSRSPSKFRLVARKSPSPSPKSPLSPSPLSPSPNRRASSTPANNPSPLVPFPPSAKLSLRSASTSHTRSISKSPRVPLRPRSNTRTSPKSPIKRPLSRTSENGNVARRSSTSPATGQENRRSESLSPLEEYERNTKNAQFNLEISAPVNMAILRLGADGANDAFNNISSPLKRSDAIMNLDQASLGSPVAKRRSLHGSAAWGQDFNVLDQPPAGSFDIHDDQNQEYELSNSALSSANLDANLFQMPRRSSSLRKSTLQQRHGDKTSWGRRHAAQQAAAQAAQFQSGLPEVSTPVSNKNRPRLSLDQFLPPMPRDSPFTSQGSLPNASVHMINQQPAAPPQPHPLSRTMTQSSSNSSLVEESPTHVPVNFGQHPKPKVDFSKSLPISAVRPERRNAIVREESGEISTPNNFKSARPLVSAFMSTGLISKVNRNPEELQMPRGGKGAMPDTPCKKQHNAFAFATYPNNQPGSPYAKAKHVRHSFGTPSTPFNPAQSQQGTFGKGRSIFGSGFGAPRRNSLLSNDGSDSGSSPDQNKGSPNAMDFDLPPTPTKQVSTANLPTGRILRGAGGPFSLNRLPPSSAFGSNLGQNVPRTSSKLQHLTIPNKKDFGDSDTPMDEDVSPTTTILAVSSIDGDVSPTTTHVRFSNQSGNADVSPTTTAFRFSNSPITSSFSRSRARRGSSLCSPAPLITKSLIPSKSLLSPSIKPGFAKFNGSASPLERIDYMERMSPRERVPHTPRESLTPPDPSSLSISNKNGPDNNQNLSSSPSSMHLPVTPSGHHGRLGFSYGGKPPSVTPVHQPKAPAIDACLAAKFERVEVIGMGEFSEVYRVTQHPTPQPAPDQTYYFGAPKSDGFRKSPSTPISDRVFAVKKARNPYKGNKDRLRKLREVEVLKALGKSDHIIGFKDSWEEQGYLYIQTELCEEGGLDHFLAKTGRRGRLDDFRIWKILLEIGLVSLTTPSLLTNANV